MKTAGADKTAIIIPAYNCAVALGQVLAGIRSIAGQVAVMVVDDGSTDETRYVPDEYDCRCIRHEKRKGKGAALRTALAWAASHEYEYAITMDADGQHAAADLPAFFAASGDLAIGKRSFTPGVMPCTRIFSNRISSFLLTKLTRTVIADSQCGYRKIRLDAIQGFKSATNGYQFETEMVLYVALARKGRIVNVPVRTIYEGQKSYIRHLPDMGEFIRAAITYSKYR